MKEEILRRMAHRRASFKREFLTYIIVMALLVLLNLWRNPTHLWVVWPALGWGAVLLYHAWRAYGPSHGSLEEEEFKKLKSKYEKKEE